MDIDTSKLPIKEWKAMTDKSAISPLERVIMYAKAYVSTCREDRIDKYDVYKQNEADCLTLRAAAVQPYAVPSGWKLVPLEPTDKMLLAAYDSVDGYEELEEDLGMTLSYKAMLKVAPTPQSVSAPDEMNKDTWRQEAIKLVPDDAVEKAFKGTNFGSSDPRSIIAETLLQLSADYSSGHTATVICRELGLYGKSGLTKKGRRYLHHAFTKDHLS